MGATPAAILARLKVTHLGWTITRSQPNGALTASRWTDTGMTHICAPDPKALETRLRDHEHGTD